MPELLPASAEQPKPLRPKLQRFCNEFVIDFNQTKAAERIGVPPGAGARVTACRWMKLPEVKAEIERLKEEQLAEQGVQRFKVLSEVAALAHSNMDDYVSYTSQGDPYFDLAKVPRSKMAAVSELQIEEVKEGRGEDKREIIRTRIKLHPKATALEMLMKNLNLLGDSGGSGDTNVQVNVIFGDL